MMELDSVTPVTVFQPDFMTDSANLTRDQAASDLGRMTPTFQTAAAIMYILTATLSIGGNLIVVCVMTCGKRSSKDLRRFLINLALTDILMGLFNIPFTYTEVMLGYWTYSDVMCPIVRFVQISAVTVSALTLVAIGADRFISIHWPHFDARLKNILTWASLVGIWTFAIALGLTQVYLSQINHFTHHGYEFGECIENWDGIWEPYQTPYSMLVFGATFLVPFILASIFYGLMIAKMCAHKAPGNRIQGQDEILQRRKLKSIKMLIAVVAAFFICWLPIQAFNLVISEWPWLYDPQLMEQSSLHSTIFFTLYFTFHWLSMGNSFVNPIIYCFMSQNFRADLTDLINRTSLKGGQSSARTRSVSTARNRPTITISSGSIDHEITPQGSIISNNSDQDRSAFNSNGCDSVQKRRILSNFWSTIKIQDPQRLSSIGTMPMHDRPRLSGKTTLV